jgi:hypothetical protein
VTHAFRRAVEARDRAAMTALMAEDVRFYSPVAFRPFVGREAAAELFANLLEVFEDFHYVDELEGDGTHALVFRATVGGKSLEGLDHLRFDDDGLIGEFTVMIRPLSGLIAMGEAMGPRVGHLDKGSADR